MKKPLCLFLPVAVIALTSCGPKAPSTTFDPLDNDIGYQWTDGNAPIVETFGAARFDIMSSKNILADNFEDMKVFKDLEKDTNVDIVWENMTGAQYDARKYLVLGNKQQWPDAIYHAGFTDLDLIRYSRRDTFVAFDQYLDYMPNFKRILEERPDIKAMLTLPDGHIYSLPRVEEMGLKQYPNILFINGAWVKDLIHSGDIDFLTEAEVKDGLDLSREEYKEILRLFKSKDMNGNGNVNDEIPLSFVYDSWQGNQSDLFASFGLPENRNHKTVVDGKITFTIQDEKYFTAINEIADWISEGLLIKNVFEHTQGDFLASGKAEVQRLGSFYWWEMDTVIKEEDQDDYVICRPLRDEDGKRYVGISNEMEIDKCEFVMFSTCEMKEVLCTWIDRQYDPYWSAQINYGAIGDSYEEELDEDGKLVNKPLPEGMTYDEHRQKVAPMGLIFLTEPEWENYVNMEDRALWRLGVLEEYVKPYTYEGAAQIPHISYDLNDLNALKAVEENVHSKIDSRLVYWLTHDGVSRSEWDAFQQELVNLGINDIVDINQRGYDALLGI